MDTKQYHALYQQSIHHPEVFWAEQARQYITWFSEWDAVQTGRFETTDVNWFVNGKLNACYNCIDRHLPTHQHKTAIIWQGDDPDDVKLISYGELHKQVCQFATVLKQLGVKSGDRVCIYLPMIPEIAIAMLACARIGAIHSVVFSAFSSEALKTRILDGNCSLVITADEGVRGGKINQLKKNVDHALEHCPHVNAVVIVKRTGNAISWNKNRDHWYHEEMQKVIGAECEAERMDANDPLFMLYTSGSTGQPKGIVHATGGYLVYVAMTHNIIFDYHEQDVHWCTADIGWITGHSYAIYGPLLNGATTLLFEGVPNFPTFSRYWEVIDKHRVTTFYTAPTAIRALRKEGDDWVTKTSRKSLKLLGTVGEPINPDVWEWYYDVVGEQRVPIVDTWWQTETGGILISALPGATPLKPGSAAWPFFGIVPEIIDDHDHVVSSNKIGKLFIKHPWPGMAKTIYGNPQRFMNAYFKEISGKYLTGDNARQDADGYFWIVGRNDDVIKVSGHRIGTGELESAFLTHPSVAEAAVIGVPDEIKGNVIYAYITIKSECLPSDELKKQLIETIRDGIGPIAIPEVIQWVRDLPKTRSGKIMRRILRKIALDEFDDLGDTSTLADANVVDDLISSQKKGW